MRKKEGPNKHMAEIRDKFLYCPHPWLAQAQAGLYRRLDFTGILNQLILKLRLALGLGAVALTAGLSYYCYFGKYSVTIEGYIQKLESSLTIEKIHV